MRRHWRTRVMQVVIGFLASLSVAFGQQCLGDNVIDVSVWSRAPDTALRGAPVVVRYVPPTGMKVASVVGLDSGGALIPVQMNPIAESAEDAVEFVWQASVQPRRIAHYRLTWSDRPATVAVTAPDAKLVMEPAEGGFRVANGVMDCLLTSSLHVRQIVCDGVKVSGGTGEAFSFLCEPGEQSRHVAVWPEPRVSIVERGPVRWRMVGRCEFEASGQQVRWQRSVEVSAWANWPSLHLRFVYGNLSDQTRWLPRGESPYLVDWHPLPGGEMTTTTTSLGEDFVAFADDLGNVGRKRLADLLHRYSTWFTTSAAEPWCDFFDSAMNPSGVGIIYPKERPFSFGVYNSGYQAEPPKPDEPFWFLCLPRQLSDRAVPPEDTVSCEIIIVPHKSDWTTTRNVWRCLGGVEVLAREVRR